MSSIARSESYDRLTELSRGVAHQRKCAAIGAFEPVGLILHNGSLSFGPSASHYVNSTPINVAPFAGTGGDGVHFSFLENGGVITDSSAIVMTVPMNFGAEKNFVLGANLHEFLSLGCYCGYYGLEQFAYDYADTIKMVESGRAGEPEWTENKIQQVLLIRLREEFGLKPWKNVRKRLDELRSSFYLKLQTPPPQTIQ